MKSFAFEVNDYEIVKERGDLRIWESLTVYPKGEIKDSKITGIVFDMILDGNDYCFDDGKMVLDGQTYSLGSGWEWDLGNMVVKLDTIEYSDENNNPITVEEAEKRLTCTKEEIYEFLCTVREWHNKGGLHDTVDIQIEKFLEDYYDDEDNY